MPRQYNQPPKAKVNLLKRDLIGLLLWRSSLNYGVCALCQCWEQKLLYIGIASQRTLWEVVLALTNHVPLHQGMGSKQLWRLVDWVQIDAPQSSRVLSSSPTRASATKIPQANPILYGIDNIQSWCGNNKSWWPVQTCTIHSQRPRRYLNSGCKSQ